MYKMNNPVAEAKKLFALRKSEMARKKLIILVIVFLFASSIFYFSCESITLPTGVFSDPSFKHNIQPIFSMSCTMPGCHDSTVKAGLVLLEGPAYINIANVNSTQDRSKKRVLPGDAENSYLVIKIEGRQSIGARMPLAREELDNIHIQNIKNWINKGAIDN